MHSPHFSFIRPLHAATGALAMGLFAACVQASPPGADSHGGTAPAGVIPTLEQGIAPAIVSLVVFAIAFAILAVKVWPVITRGLEERAGKIREEIMAAEAARRQAREALEQYERSLAEARAEAQRMLEQARAQQQMLSSELRAKADQELALMKDRARRDIESAKRAALAEVYNEVTDTATRMASSILHRELNAADQRRLLQQSVSRLETLKS